MKKNTRAMGDMAEEGVCRFLISQGHVILERNCYIGKVGEIDIIARDGIGCIHFVEVRSRRSLSPHYQYLSRKKLVHLRTACLIWLKLYGLREYETAWQIDLIVTNLQKNYQIYERIV